MSIKERQQKMLFCCLSLFVEKEEHMNEKKSTKIRKIAFWPAFILLFGSLIYSIVDQDGFYAMASLC